LMVTARFLGKKKRFKGKYAAQYGRDYYGDMFYGIVERTIDSRLNIGSEIHIDVTDVVKQSLKFADLKKGQVLTGLIMRKDDPYTVDVVLSPLKYLGALF